MAVDIPPEVAEFLDCCGVRYPDIDEGDVRGLAVKVRTFAANTRGLGVDESGDALAAYERLVATWAASDGGHQVELDRVCAVIAKALDAVAYVITVTKAVVLTELAALAMTYAAMTATPSARIAGPLLAAAARRLCTQMERALIGYLVIEVIGRAVEPLGRGTDKLFTGAPSLRTSPAERVDEPRGLGALPAESRRSDLVPDQSRVSGAVPGELQRPDVVAAGSRVSGAVPAELQLPDMVAAELWGAGPAEPPLPMSSAVPAELPMSGAVPAESPMSGAVPAESRMPGAVPAESRTPGAVPGEPPMFGMFPAEPQLSDAAPGEDMPVTDSGDIQSSRVGPRMQPPLGPSRSRGFVTPWAHAVRASEQRAAFSKTIPAKAFQSLDRRATTARKPRETPWSKFARKSEATSSELAVTVPTIRHREEGDR
ncbi:hypothetical protein ACIBG0_00110 [Nocardia sp. NPDC050630]|uniref:hypothetical protein n=1 Tax=Nocardia sp. NPDC050630 TaxID=3364321 RepID=UPI0037AD8578